MKNNMYPNILKRKSVGLSRIKFRLFLNFRNGFNGKNLLWCSFCSTYRTELLCCTRETKIMLYTNFTSKKKNLNDFSIDKHINEEKTFQAEAVSGRLH